MLSRRRRTVVVAAAVAAIVTAANASEGGYFSQSWGWIALAFLIPTTTLVILDRATVPGRLRVALAVSMGALAAWIALSSLWSISSSASAREVERTLVYVALALAVALVLRRGDTTAVIAGGGIGASLVSGYALATRLIPDRFDTYDDPIVSYRLAEPLGYWNALGLLATIGLLVLLGFVAHAHRRAVVGTGGFLVPLLATTLYFTFSRGAWIALGVGLLAMVALDPRRLRLAWCTISVSLPAMACIAYASQQDALTTEDAPVGAAAREGHRVAVVVVCAAAASTLLALGARVLAERLPVTPRTRRAFDAGLVLAGLAAVAVVLVAVGGPVKGWDKLEQQFNTDLVAAPDLNERLFNVSGNGRGELWHVALQAAKDRPLAGQGAGSFEYVWYEQRDLAIDVRDGHSLYLETLAELGIVGLALLGAALSVLLLGGLRARRSRLAASGVGAFVAWAVASAVDWHWEMVGVTLTALLMAAAAMLASERHRSSALSSGARLALVGVTGTLSVLAVWSLVGNQALFAGREAIARKDWADARADARRAHELLPWSWEALVLLGDAEAGGGQREGALSAYRDAVDKDPENWVAWLRLARVAGGAERAAAYQRVHRLNPLERGLPSE
jgi:O-antigen ligase